MYIFEALKYLMYQESAREFVDTANSWKERRDIRGIELHPAYAYSKESNVYSMLWSEHLENNTFNLRFSNEDGFKRVQRLFSRVRPGKYVNSDGTLITRV